MDVSPCIKARNEKENLNQMLLEVEQAKEQLSQACAFIRVFLFLLLCLCAGVSLKCETKKIKTDLWWKAVDKRKYPLGANDDGERRSVAFGCGDIWHDPMVWTGSLDKCKPTLESFNSHQLGFIFGCKFQLIYMQIRQSRRNKDFGSKNHKKGDSFYFLVLSPAISVIRNFRETLEMLWFATRSFPVDDFAWKFPKIIAKSPKLRVNKSQSSIFHCNLRVSLRNCDFINKELTHSNHWSVSADTCWMNRVDENVFRDFYAIHGTAITRRIIRYAELREMGKVR